MDLGTVERLVEKGTVNTPESYAEKVRWRWRWRWRSCVGVCVHALAFALAFGDRLVVAFALR